MLSPSLYSLSILIKMDSLDVVPFSLLNIAFYMSLLPFLSVLVFPSLYSLSILVDILSRSTPPCVMPFWFRIACCSDVCVSRALEAEIRHRWMPTASKGLGHQIMASVTKWSVWDFSASTDQWSL